MSLSAIGASTFLRDFIPECNIPTPINDLLYTGYVYSKVRGQGLGKEIWKLAEEHFYEIMEYPYYRLVSDGTGNGWADRTLGEVLTYLNSRGIRYEVLKELEYEGINFYLISFIK